MRASRLWAIGALLLVGFGAAQAQVQLVYKLDGREHVISGTEGRLIYRDQGKRLPITGKGTWEIRPAESYATPLGSVDVSYYFQPWLRQPAMKETVELCFRLEYHAQESIRHLYYVCAWEVDGKLVAVTARQFFDAEAKKTPWIFGQMPIDAADRRGRLRAYLFTGDKSLRGVDKNDLDLVAFRAALDQGDTVKAAAWLRAEGQGRLLPQSLVEQVARSGDATLLELALGGPNAKHLKGKEGKGLLMAAAETGREACVEVLLQHKIDPDAAGEEGNALYRATDAQATGVVGQLLAAGAKPERDWEGGYSPLRRSLQSGNAEVSRLLFDHGAKVPEKWKTTIFADAVATGHGALVTLLLQREANPNALLQPVLREGKTAIMLAASVGEDESVAALQQAGASLTIHDDENRTPASWALKAGNEKLAIRLFKQAPLAGLPASRLLHDALLANSDELVALLLAADATLDLGAANLEVVLAQVVRTGNVAVLNRALSRGLDVDRKFHSDWNLAGMAERYHQPQVTEALEKHAGRKVERSLPKPQKQEVSVSKAGPMMGSRELGPDFRGGEAQVDIYIDAEGVPHLPMLRSTTNERLGRAALGNILTWRFNRGGAPGVWRRIIFPYDLPEPDTAEKFAQTIFFDGELPWIDPESFPSPGTVGETGVKEAGWVRFDVSAKGEVIRPHVFGVSTPGIEDQVLAVLKSWKFYPARQAGEDVAYPMECVVILPGKLCVLPNCCVLLSDSAPDDFPATMIIEGDMRTQAQKTSGSASKNALVLGLFTIDRTGFPGKLKILGSPSPVLAALAQASYNNMTFKPLVIDRKETEYRMAMVLVFRDVNSP